jgi:hypothetical protein
MSIGTGGRQQKRQRGKMPQATQALGSCRLPPAYCGLPTVSPASKKLFEARYVSYNGPSNFTALLQSPSNAYEIASDLCACALACAVVAIARAFRKRSLASPYWPFKSSSRPSRKRPAASCANTPAPLAKNAAIAKQNPHGCPLMARIIPHTSQPRVPSPQPRSSSPRTSSRKGIREVPYRPSSPTRRHWTPEQGRQAGSLRKENLPQRGCSAVLRPRQ